LIEPGTVEQETRLKFGVRRPKLWYGLPCPALQGLHFDAAHPSQGTPRSWRSVYAVTHQEGLQFHSDLVQAVGWAREARLKPEYADEYAGITAGIWIPVAELASGLIQRVYTARREGRHTRTFDPTHFEFRGGSTEPRARMSRTRSTDREL
jgi:hypothetical protein